jgi:ammonium transporter, Amt family
MLGPRLPESDMADRKRAVHYKPHNPLLMVLGTVLIWFGWFAFNGMSIAAEICGRKLTFSLNLGGSTANLSLRSIYVVANTNFSACAGGIAWVLLGYLHTRKFSLVGFCSGIIAGLVGITPAAGFTLIYVAPVIGGVTSLV